MNLGYKIRLVGSLGVVVMLDLDWVELFEDSGVKLSLCLSFEIRENELSFDCIIAIEDEMLFLSVLST